MDVIANMNHDSMQYVHAQLCTRENFCDPQLPIQAVNTPSGLASHLKYFNKNQTSSATPG